MTIQLSDHFTYGRLLRFTIPTMVMMVFTSIYGVIDGLFVSNFVGKEAFSALNLIYPLIMMLGALGFMFGTRLLLRRWAKKTANVQTVFFLSLFVQSLLLAFFRLLLFCWPYVLLGNCSERMGPFLIKRFLMGESLHSLYLF